MRDFFVSNRRLKAVALAFAIALWFFVAGQSRTEVGVLVPISFKGVPKEMVMTSVPPGDIEVRVTGPRLFISNLSPAQILAEIDLSGAKEGLNTFKIQPADITTPMGTEVLRFRPNSIEVKLERLSRTALPVRARVVGKVAAGYRIADIVVSPRTVTATATKKELSDTGAVFTKPLDVTGLEATKSVSVQLDTAGGALRALSPDKVDVKVVIRREKQG